MVDWYCGKFSVGKAWLESWQVPRDKIQRTISFSFLIPPQQKFGMGSLAQLQCDPATPGSGQDSRRFWCRAAEGSVLEGSVADTFWGSGAFRCRYLVRFWRIPVQVLGEIAVQILGQVLEGYGAGAWWGSGSFPCSYTWLGSGRSRWGSGGGPGADTCARFRKVPVQRPCEVPGFGGEHAWWGSGGFRCRYFVRIWKVLVQILCETLKSSDVVFYYNNVMAYALNFLWHKRWCHKHKSFQGVGDIAPYLIIVIPFHGFCAHQSLYASKNYPSVIMPYKAMRNTFFEWFPPTDIPCVLYLTSDLKNSHTWDLAFL